MFSTHLMKYFWYSPQKSKYPLFIVILRVGDAENRASQEPLDAVAFLYSSEKEVGLVEGIMQEGYGEAVQYVVPL